MTKSPLTISVRDSIPDVVDLFLEKKFRSLPVVDDDQYPIGLLTEFELTKTFIYIHFNKTSNDQLGDHLEILEVPSILFDDTPIPNVVRAIGQSPTNRVLIIYRETNKLAGIISPRDVLQFLKGERQEKLKMSDNLEDIERKLKEVIVEKEVLEEKYHLYSSVYDDSPYMMHSANKHGIITIANKKLHQFLGYEDGELIGKTVFDLYSRDHHNSAKLGLQQLIDEGYHEVVYTHMVTKNHWEKAVDVSSSSVYDKRQQFVCTITISREINTEEMWKALQAVESAQSKYGTKK